MKSRAKVIATTFENADPSAIISLFKVDLKERGEYRFHAGENGYGKKIVFNNQAYEFFPIRAEGFEVHGDGTLPRPKLTLSNHQGAISLRLNTFDDFINYKVTRIKTFVKYLDDINFPNGSNPHAEPDPEATFSEDIFFVNQKTREDDNIVEFELVSVLELQNANVPARTVYSNHCPWRYRSTIGCCYTGAPIADDKNKRFVPSGYQGGDVGSDVYFPSEFGSKKFGGATPIYPEWSVSTTYDKGDIVALTPVDNDAETNPAGIYVCTKDNVKSNPRYDSQSWVMDDCSRNLYGCRLRFADAATGAGGGGRYLHYGGDGFWTESEEGLPFGGFPGVDPYEYK